MGEFINWVGTTERGPKEIYMLDRLLSGILCSFLIRSSHCLGMKWGLANQEQLRRIALQGLKSFDPFE